MAECSVGCLKIQKVGKTYCAALENLLLYVKNGKVFVFRFKLLSIKKLSAEPLVCSLPYVPITSIDSVMINDTAPEN